MVVGIGRNRRIGLIEMSVVLTRLKRSKRRIASCRRSLRGFGEIHPLLLDPTQWGDPDLLTFNGAGEPTCADPRDPVAALRVKLSVKLLSLDTEKLCEGRRDTWRSCERRLKDMRGIVEAQRHQNNTDAGDRLKDLCRDLDDLYDEEAEFTATAWACAKELNAEMIVRLAKEVARSLD